MNLLLDTNALYWWLNAPGRLSEEAEAAISDEANFVMVSAVVPWELAIKTNLRKIEAQRLLEIWEAKLAEERFAELSIQSSHAILAGSLPNHHRDPFDRMLAAQSQATGWPVVSADPIFEKYGVRRIW
jgi:PIN domain nuclease of toxin-antitoxin system